MLAAIVGLFLISSCGSTKSNSDLLQGTWISADDAKSEVKIEGNKYIEYYEAALTKTRPGGFLIADNTLWSGKVLENDIPENDHFTRGVMRFNDHVQADPRVENILLPVFDGMMLIRVKQVTSDRNRDA